MTDATLPDAPNLSQDSRSLWATAMLRLRKNRAAMASLVVLILMAIAGLVGPALAPHSYAEVYPEFVKVAPSLKPYPQAENVLPAAEAALRRARVDVGEITVEGGTVSIAVSSSREIDPRVSRYLDRSDVFSNANAEVAADGRAGALRELAGERRKSGTISDLLHQPIGDVENLPVVLGLVDGEKNLGDPVARQVLHRLLAL